MTFNSQRKFMLGGAAVLALTVFAGNAQSASAATIVMQGAQSVSFNTMGEFRDSDGILAASRTIDQGGLNIKYNQNGAIDDQDAYLARKPKHTDSTSQEWFSRNNTSFGFIDFDLGANYDLRNVVLWNEDFAGIKDFVVSTSLSADTGFSYVRSFTAENAPVSDPDGVRDFIEKAQLFELSDTGIQARYVSLLITSVWNKDLNNRDVYYRRSQAQLGSLASIGEVAFGVNQKPGEVPTPALLPGLIGLGATAWRKRRQLATK
jgi:hypothetical protein